MPHIGLELAVEGSSLIKESNYMVLGQGRETYITGW
jgi:hypothetical protein